MDEHALLCKQCRVIFKLSVQPGPWSGGDWKCPKCGNTEVEVAPAWAPLGSGQNIFESSEWEYQCQKCLNKFKLPVPKSPSEEKEKTCPTCGSRHLHLLTDLGALPLYCG